MNNDKKRLNAKDLIITGVFALLFLMAAMLGGGPFATVPTLTFYFPIGSAILAGPIFMLFIAKVPKQGALAIIGAVECILGTLTGMHWGMNFGFLICCIIAAVIAGIKKFESPVFNLIAYLVYCIGPMGTYFVFFFNRESWISFMLKKGTQEEYIQKMSETASPSIMITMVVGTLVVAALSGLLGLRLMRKQFIKAGIAA
ncbi:energy-coupling factor transport system substrate-specific component [Acetitomaculum ruminis DSM 5522]|uniref:Energy-coupling factor transport system substrate-specific component n=1 Tax=Acetitomaculum ruminis DSM 5522 TaxID=1120918 RepID=A0A1I1A2B7_9FIRM|nr:MptD family putative ECF transporter S component [Acetitomaculum ruminis]SFB32144.1 energy-coupling factor transport system substrate-specific component [Acetitomaculum ruminis DSM 5522]